MVMRFKRIFIRTPRPYLEHVGLIEELKLIEVYDLLEKNKDDTRAKYVSYTCVPFVHVC